MAKKLIPFKHVDVGFEISELTGCLKTISQLDAQANTLISVFNHAEVPHNELQNRAEGLLSDVESIQNAEPAIQEVLHWLESIKTAREAINKAEMFFNAYGDRSTLEVSDEELAEIFN